MKTKTITARGIRSSNRSPSSTLLHPGASSPTNDMLEGKLHANKKQYTHTYLAIFYSL